MTTATTGIRHGTTMRVPRTRGALSGLVLIVLGVWGAVIPFVGPSFDYGYTPMNSWDWTMWRFWLEVLPGAAAVLGGLILLASADRIRGSVGGWLGAAAGAWFILGLPFASMVSINGVGVPSGSSNTRAWETVGMFTGLGAVILLFAALALGRLSVVGVRDVAAAERFGKRREAARAAEAREADRIAASRAADGRPDTVDVARAERRDARVDNARSTAGEPVGTEPQRDMDVHDRDRAVGHRRRLRL